MDMIIKNGTVVTDSEMFRADVAVKDGKLFLSLRASTPVAVTMF